MGAAARAHIAGPEHRGQRLPGGTMAEFTAQMQPVEMLAPGGGAAWHIMGFQAEGRLMKEEAGEIGVGGGIIAVTPGVMRCQDLAFILRLAMGKGI